MSIDDNGRAKVKGTMCGLLSSVERVLLEMTRVDCRRARRAFRASIVAASTCNKGVGSEIVLLGANWVY